MEVKIWTQEGCVLCEQVKSHFQTAGFEEHPVENLLNGTEKELDAMVQLSMQNMELPLIQVDGQWLSPAQALALEAVSAA